ncbi:MAG: tetratricopeptide repeat protein, partial [Candidatus Manganitrophus sp. SB1]|nr:tetratricopeptide repeat protein [Candidatus Manganitrophus morganii]
MQIPETLKERLSSGNVIPFIGSGVSMAVRNAKTGNQLFPSWKELLWRAAIRLEQEGKTKDATLVRSLLEIDPPDYLEAASRARQSLKAVWFEFLKKELDHPREMVEDKSLELARCIWGLGSRLLITTNYDRILNWTCPEQHNLCIWDVEAPAEQIAALREGPRQIKRPSVWHLHGHIDNVTNLILTPDGYKLLYPETNGVNTQYQAAIETLRAFLAPRTFLFIGFSLDDSYFGAQLKLIDTIFKGTTGPHYVLAREVDRERIKALGIPLEILTVPDFGQPLLDLLHNIRNVASECNSPGSNLTIKSLDVTTQTYAPRNPVFFVPYRSKGNQVVGREAALQAVRKQLTQGHHTAIGQTAAFQGLGGLGKTQLAVEYAYRYRSEYPNGVIWLSADQDIDAQLTELSEKARWIAPESEHKYKLEVAQQRVRSYSDCLIIFDNLENLDTIKEYLPFPDAEPHILITSRTDQPGFTPVPLDPLDNSLSFKLLIQEAHREPIGEEDYQSATEIAETLGGLPLALELAGAYLCHRPSVSWPQYRDLLKKNLKAALPDKFLRGSFTQHESDLWSTLKVNEEVFSEEPRLRDVLDLLTWSGPAPMGHSLLCTLLATQNPTELINAFGLGTALRLLQKTPETESYAIHRLVREVRQEDISLVGRKEWVEKICKLLGNWFQERKDDFANLPSYEAEIDHLRAWQEHALIYSVQHVARLTWLQAYPPYHRGRYQEAEQLVKKAISFFEQEQQNDLELKAHLLADLGFTSSALGDHKRQLEYSEKALAIRRDLFGEQHPDIATSLNSIGNAYGALGDHKRQLEYFEKALAIRRDLFGEQHPGIASSLNSIGNAYGDLGDHKRQLEYSEKALALSRDLFGERHPKTATYLNNIGNAYGALGDHKRQLEYSEKALALSRDLFGERHP